MPAVIALGLTVHGSFCGNKLELCDDGGTYFWSYFFFFELLRPIARIVTSDSMTYACFRDIICYHFGRSFNAWLT